MKLLREVEPPGEVRVYGTIGSFEFWIQEHLADVQTKLRIHTMEDTTWGVDGEVMISPYYKAGGLFFDYANNMEGGYGACHEFGPEERTAFIEFMVNNYGYGRHEKNEGTMAPGV